MKTKKITIHLDKDPDGNYGSFDEKGFETNRKNSKPAKARHKFRQRLREALTFAHKQIQDPEMRRYYREMAKRLKLRNSFQAAVEDYLQE